MNMWTVVVITPEDRIHPINEEYGPQTWLYNTEYGLERGLAENYDPMNLRPDGMDIVEFLIEECDYDIRITEHSEVEHNA